MDRPVVSFETDITADLYMFSSDPDALDWGVVLLNEDGSQETIGPTTDYRTNVGDGLAPDETCWLVESTARPTTLPMVIEIHRPGKPLARAHHPRWGTDHRNFKYSSTPRTLRRRHDALLQGVGFVDVVDRDPFWKRGRR